MKRPRSRPGSKPPLDRKSSPRELGEQVREVWDANAAFWDEKMGDGNLTHSLLVSPTMERLLALRGGERVLEIACGNGQFARRLAGLGAQVLATDFSDGMLARARARSGPFSDSIEYRHLDATSRAALRSLGAHRFSAVVCPMALMDMEQIQPLAAELAGLLAEGGRFVFSVTHPCFNTTGSRRIVEEEDDQGKLAQRSGVFVYRYSTPVTAKGFAILGQPVPQYYFDRPLNALLRPFFEAGLALDALEEPGFAPDVPATRPASWISLREIPPVLVGRLRPFGRP